MSLSWRDLWATVLIIGVAGSYYAWRIGANLPIISNVRWVILAIGILGVFMCALGSDADDAKQFSNPMILLLSVLGAASLLLVIVGLITGSSLMLNLLFGTLVVLWLGTTARHVMR